MHKRRPLLVALLALSTAFGAGVLATATMGRAWASSYRKLDVFARVLAYVENNYVDEVDAGELVYGAIKGMLSVLDPHTVFLTPEELRAMRSDTSGEFGGLGIEVGSGDDGLLVVAPLDDTPASRAGILAGDRILAIDGESTEGLSAFDAASRMRGPPGSKVVLTVMRDAFQEPQDLTLLRDRIRVKSVVSKLYPGGYGYVRIKSFQARTDRALGKALAKLHEQNGGAELNGLVLDLRNNPGGLVEEAVRVADRFLDRGLIVTTEGRGGKQLEVEQAHPAGTQAGYPIITLVNGGSASASEIVAAALQDHGRAVIMGTTTFGKGSVQTVIDLEDGSGLKLTIARYYTPKHRSIQGKGIVPDVVVPAEVKAVPKADRPKEADLPGALQASGKAVETQHVEVDDHQLQAALDTLHTWGIFKAGLSAPHVSHTETAAAAGG